MASPRVRLRPGGVSPARAADGGAERPLGDVLALGEDRGGVGHDLLEGGLRCLGDRFGGLTGADPGLDVAGSKTCSPSSSPLVLGGRVGSGRCGCADRRAAARSRASTSTVNSPAASTEQSGLRRP